MIFKKKNGKGRRNLLPSFFTWLMVKEMVKDKVTFEQRPRKCENVSYVYIWRKHFQAEGIASTRLHDRNMP